MLLFYISAALKMDPARRLALRSRTYRVRVLLLDDAGSLDPSVGLAPTSPVYETDASLSTLTRNTSGDRAGTRTR